MPHLPTALAQLDTEHLLASAHADFHPLASTALERELQRRLEELSDQAERDRPFLAALEDAGIDTSGSPEPLVALIDAAYAIDDEDLAEGAAFLEVVHGRDFGADELDEMLLALSMEDLVTGSDVRRILDEHDRMCQLLADAEDVFEALSGTSAKNESMLGEYRDILARVT